MAGVLYTLPTVLYTAGSGKRIMVLEYGSGKEWILDLAWHAGLRPFRSGEMGSGVWAACYFSFNQPKDLVNCVFLFDIYVGVVGYMFALSQAVSSCLVVCQFLVFLYPFRIALTFIHYLSFPHSPQEEKRNGYFSQNPKGRSCCYRHSFRYSNCPLWRCGFLPCCCCR